MTPMSDSSIPVASPGRSPKPLRPAMYEQMMAEASHT
jgi:hypothetical protein